MICKLGFGDFWMAMCLKLCTVCSSFHFCRVIPWNSWCCWWWYLSPQLVPQMVPAAANSCSLRHSAKQIPSSSTECSPKNQFAYFCLIVSSISVMKPVLFSNISSTSFFFGLLPHAFVALLIPETKPAFLIRWHPWQQGCQSWRGHARSAWDVLSLEPLWPVTGSWTKWCIRPL